MAYKYQGTGGTAAKWKLMPCGTPAAYERHLRKKEIPCAPCLEAERIRYRNRRKPREYKPCGTNAAYRRHLRNGEPICEPCRKAHTGYQLNLRKQAKKAANQ